MTFDDHPFAPVFRTTEHIRKAILGFCDGHGGHRPLWPIWPFWATTVPKKDWTSAPDRGCQPARLVTMADTGLMWANMLRAFHVGKARTSDGEPSSWMRPSRVAWAHASWPACHLTKASASAVM